MVQCGLISQFDKHTLEQNELHSSSMSERP